MHCSVEACSTGSDQSMNPLASHSGIYLVSYIGALDFLQCPLDSQVFLKCQRQAKHCTLGAVGG